MQAQVKGAGAYSREVGSKELDRLGVCSLPTEEAWTHCLMSLHPSLFTCKSTPISWGYYED